VEHRREEIKLAHAKLSDELAQRITEVERELLEEAVRQKRVLPYMLKIETESHEALAFERISGTEKDGILAGKAIDGPSWTWKSLAELGIAEAATISLKSEIEPLHHSLDHPKRR